MKNLVSIMKNICLLIFAGLLTLYGTNAVAKGQHIGVVDLSIAVENSLYGKEYQEKRQKQVEPMQKSLQKQQENLRKKHTNLQRDKDILSANERTEKEKELTELEMKFQQNYEQFEFEMKTYEQRESAKIHKSLVAAIKNIASKKQYNLVIPSNMALYFSAEVVDLTTEVTDALNQMFKTAAKSNEKP